MEKEIPIGKLYAVLDYFEAQTHQPLRASVLKRTIPGLTRADLRELEHKGRLQAFYMRMPNGVIEKAYLRPKERQVAASGQEAPQGQLQVSQ